MFKKIDVAIFVIFVAIFLSSLVPKNFFDLWWHLATGKYILTNTIPKHDVFSYTALGTEWIDHEWLSQVIFYSFFVKFGLKSLLLLESLCLLASFILLYKRSTLLTSRGMAVVATVSAYGLFARYSITESVRPYIFSILFVSLFVYIIDGFLKNGGKRIWILPVLVLLWSNLHGGFIIGILLLVSYSLGSAFSKDYRAAKKLVLVTLAAGAASAFNPNTYKLILYPLQYAQYSIHARFISEWQSPTFHEFGIYEGMLLATILIMAAYKKPVNASDMILLLVFTHFSLFAARNISLFAIVCVPIIMKYLEVAICDATNKKFNTNFTGIGYGAFGVWLRSVGLSDLGIKKITGFFLPSFLYSLVFLGMLFFLYSYPLDKVLYESPESELPADAVEFIAEGNVTGNMFNFYRWGGYIIWKLYPDHKVFIDGRADVYGDFIYDYISIIGLKPNWSNLLDKYDVSFVLIPAELPLGEMLNEKEWETVYEDDVSVILKRGHGDVN